MNTVAGGAGRLSKRLIISYIADWIVIILIAVVGALFTKIPPNRRPFSPVDANISFPYKLHETISTSTLLLVSLVAPGIIIFLVCLLFVPGPTLGGKGAPKSLIWRRKLWEWNTGWMGLGLALASAFLLTDGMKYLFGKPRPDLLSRCNPDLKNIQNYAVGGYGDQINEGILLVSWHICRQTDMSILNDGFASFPSGHSSFSWAGLIYLTLFLCSKFAIAIPFLAPRSFSTDTASAFTGRGGHRREEYSSHSQSKDIPLSNLGGPPNSPEQMSQSSVSNVPLRNQAAAPPTYLLVIAFIPIAAAIYISSTRYSDFRHHGFDIIFGSLMGFALAWFSFRWFHLPIRQGAGWSWGARSRDRAFAVPVGVQGYVGYEGWEKAMPSYNADLESGQAMNSERVTGAGGLNGVEQTRFHETQREGLANRL
ncbi:MAG: hypothetical protein M1830_006085 [Pleopsidium flavum]|nr:MAG: hypothetical protein M1830_006085 [Pleopsidium flavum]